jgi:hypothetical protein
MHGATGLIRAVLHIDRAPDEMIKARREICKPCPHLSAAKALLRIRYCDKCKCLLKAKTEDRKEKCCDGRW